MTKILLPLIALALSCGFCACTTTHAHQGGSCCAAPVKKSCGAGDKACSTKKKSKKSDCCH